MPDGEVGEMLVRGPSAGDGYWNQRDKSRATFEGNWTRSGDKYVRDAEGFYTYQGRTDDMFKVSGIWVSPFEVESALIGHDAVLEAAVVPKEDTDGLLKPKAFIVLKPGKTAANGLQDDAEGAREGQGRACGNIRAGSKSSKACPRRRQARSSGSSCARAQAHSLAARQYSQRQILAVARWRPSCRGFQPQASAERYSHTGV